MNDADKEHSAADGNRGRQKRRRDQEHAPTMNNADQEGSAENGIRGRTKRRRDEANGSRMNDVQRNDSSQNVDARFTVDELKTHLGTLANLQYVLTFLEISLKEKLEKALENQGHVSS